MDKLLNKPPISVGNVPLVPYLKKVKEEELVGEIRNVVYIGELSEKELSRKRISPTVVRRRRALPRGPARSLDDEQVRQEYGIMSKPFEDFTKNVLWVLKKNTTVTPKQAAKILGTDKKIYTSQTLRKLYAALRFEGNNLISRHPLKKTFRYRLTPLGKSMEIEELFIAYREKTLPADIADREVPPAEVEDVIIDVQPEQPKTEILQGLAENGLRVTISGRVDVVFRFER